MNQLDPKSLSLSDAARLLSRTSGRPVTEELLREAVSAGLPLKAGDRVDIFVLAAWLNKQLVFSIRPSANAAADAK
jgi:hypothetical protein